MEFDINRGARLILILNFRFGQCRFVVRAPVNRLHALVDIATLSHLTENLDLSGLIIVRQREVRAIPVADDTKTLKLRTLGINMIVRKLLALGAELCGRNLITIHTVGFNRLPLDRQTMGIPARDIRCLISHHIARAHDKIFEDFIERMAHMQVAVCIRRAVV